MIPPGIDNTDVLRRTLIDLDSRTINVQTPISTTVKIDIDTSPPVTEEEMEEIVAKINELVETVNAIASTLNSARNNNF